MKTTNLFVLILLTASFYFTACKPKKDTATENMPEKEQRLLVVNDSTPEMALDKYIAALKAGDANKVKTVLLDPSYNYELPGKIPITNYTVRLKKSLRKSDAQNFNLKFAPLPGDMQLSVAEDIEGLGKQNFTYWFRKQNGNWRLASWTAWSDSLNIGSAEGFKDTSNLAGSVVQYLQMPNLSVSFADVLPNAAYTIATFKSDVVDADEELAPNLSQREAHIANMISLTVDYCEKNPNEDFVVYWDYYTNKGKNFEGQYAIANRAAKSLADVLGNTKETTDISVQKNGKTQKVKVPMLNLNNEIKTTAFKTFTASLKPLDEVKSIKKVQEATELNSPPPPKTKPKILTRNPLKEHKNQ
ncbi:MAG: hypothetical protein R2798_14805 [Chitinophagales bacterium]